MDDNKNQNQTNTATSDYQKILDEYAASVKPEDNQTPQNKTEDESINVSLKETTSAKVEVEKPITPQVSNTLIDDLEKEIIPKIPDEAPEKSSTPELKSINSPQLESPIHPSLAANLESDDEPGKPIVDLPSLPPKEDPKSVNIPAPTLPPETPVDVKPEKSPEEIKAEINRLLTDDETKPTSPDTSNPTKTSSVGKVFFIFALILFLIIAAGLAYFLFLVPSNTTKNKTDNSTPSVTPTLSETNDNSSNESGICELNNKTYQVGESFTSADGCNTCSCSSAGVITCTEKACTGTPTVTTATKSATTNSSIPLDWKSYVDTTYKVSINYPSDWTLSKISNGFSLISSERKKIKETSSSPSTPGPEINVYLSNSLTEVFGSNAEKTLKGYVFNSSISGLREVKEISINGVSGYHGYTDYPTYSIYLQKNTTIVHISQDPVMTETEYNSSEIKKIIDTIKFN